MKVAAENLLTSEDDNLLEGQHALYKIGLVLRFLPLMALTAVFRIGSSAIIIYHFILPHFLLQYYAVFSSLPVFTIFISSSYLFLCDIFGVFLLCILRPWSKTLKQLTLLEIYEGVQGEKFTTTVWGKLGRRGSRGIQLAVATVFLIKNITCITLVLNSSFGLHLESPRAIPEIMFCHFLLCCGFISYTLAIIQLS